MVAEERPPQGGLGGTGTVLASFGRSVLLQTSTQIMHCGLLGRKMRVVCGDQVEWARPSTAGAASVQSVNARRNLVERIDARGRPEPVAANIDQLAIVLAEQPLPDWFLADRYWAAALLKELEAMIVINKSDLGTGALQPELAQYRQLQVPCAEVSAATLSGIDTLRGMLAGKITMLVGQSGVGKSSLLNALIPSAAAQTNMLTRDAEGKHTTTTARWYQLEGGGAIIDAPGVRDFAPPASLVRAAERGFAEILARSTDCRFKDCRHLEEPGCAVRAAVLNRQIAPRRYESYRRLLRLYQMLAP